MTRGFSIFLKNTTQHLASCLYHKSHLPTSPFTSKRENETKIKLEILNFGLPCISSSSKLDNERGHFHCSQGTSEIHIHPVLQALQPLHIRSKFCSYLSMSHMAQTLHHHKLHKH
uniref:Uncharacterized protein n=1 Tax=Opuntia streptacantha TaxID=393608 RepID=A0A7C9E3J0_OPUST